MFRTACSNVESALQKATVPDLFRSGIGMTRALDRLASLRAEAALVVSDQGAGSTGHAVLRWVQGHGAIGMASRRAGPCRMLLRRVSSAGSGNECLNEQRFATLCEACGIPNQVQGRTGVQALTGFNRPWTALFVRTGDPLFPILLQLTGFNRPWTALFVRTQGVWRSPDRRQECNASIVLGRLSLYVPGRIYVMYE